jgi:hypothetical protein
MLRISCEDSPLQHEQMSDLGGSRRLCSTGARDEHRGNDRLVRFVVKFDQSDLPALDVQPGCRNR